MYELFGSIRLRNLNCKMLTSTCLVIESQTRDTDCNYNFLCITMFNSKCSPLDLQ